MATKQRLYGVGSAMENNCPSCGVEEGQAHRKGCLRAYGDRVADAVEAVRTTSITLRIPKEVEPYAQDIRRFAEAMVYKLSVHAHKGKWENASIEGILDKLEGEVKELREAVQRGNMVEILLEAADVGNYGLIASAIAMERGK